MDNETGDTDDVSTSDAPKMYLGPYEFWNFGPGRKYAFPAIRGAYSFLSALLEYKDEMPLPEVPRSEETFNGQPRRWEPTLWGRRTNENLRFLPIVVENTEVTIPDVETLTTLLSEALGPPFIEGSRFRVAFPVNERTMNERFGRLPQDPMWRPDENVKDRIGIPERRRINVIAVIDDGIPFAHRNFRSADGKRTRVEFCWLQSARHDVENQSPSVLFGEELTRECINKLIDQFGDDEDELYRHAGALEMQYERGAAIRRLGTHGAHVMDIAAGCDLSACEPPEETRIVAVQLPNTTAWDTSGFGKDMYLLSAVHYVLERAERIGEGYGEPNIRVVINFSYGFSGGRHDGQSELEAAIDELIAKRRCLKKPTAIVLPSGNTFVDRMHAVIWQRDLEGGEFSFAWSIQPNDRTSSYLEIWFPAGFEAKGFEVCITEPNGRFGQTVPVEADPRNTVGDPRTLKPIPNGKKNEKDEDEAIGQLSADNHRMLKRWRALIALAPTEPEGDRLPATPAGKWTVTVKRGTNRTELTGPIRCWIQRDSDPDVTRNGRRQSYFDHPGYAIFNDEGTIKQTDEPGGLVRRFGSVNGLATGSTSLIVAGFKASAENAWDMCHPVPAAYSSAGFLPLESDPCEKEGQPANQDQSESDVCHSEKYRRERVDCSSLSDRSNVLLGTIAAGTRSGSVSILQGTSAAAPVVARRLAAAFAEVSDDDVVAAEGSNYLELLTNTGIPPSSRELKARLGEKLVFPDRPGPCDSMTAEGEAVSQTDQYKILPD